MAGSEIERLAKVIGELASAQQITAAGVERLQRVLLELSW